jgi:hypothetical protein
VNPFFFDMWCLGEELTAHALYMRLKRLCEKKSNGQLQVDPAVHESWVSGNREEMFLAMCNSLKKFGFNDNAKVRNLVRARFVKKPKCCCFLQTG